MRSKARHKRLISNCLLAVFATALAGCANLGQPRYWGDCAIKGGVIGAFIGGGNYPG
jgi:hypothetical protein